MTFRKLYSCVSVFFTISLPSNLIDLEDFSQEFVVKTKQIVLKEYPDAFNPSIIRWQNKILMSFRTIPDSKNSFVSYIGLVWLGQDFKPITKPVLLDLRGKSSTAPSRAEDGRLISIKNRLYLVYSDNEDQTISKKGFRVYIAQILCNTESFQVLNTEKLSLFEGNDLNQREKNWVPFVTKKDTLLLSYSIAPHTILKPHLNGTEFCQSLGSTECTIDWQWGELRGGTTALLYGDHYMAFFHSSVMMESVHCKKPARHYFIGCYTFSAQFPFALTRVSSSAIIGKNFYHGPSYKPYWGSIAAVFPCGFIDAGEHIILAYGRQDHELWIAKIEKKGLYESLVPVGQSA